MRLALGLMLVLAGCTSWKTQSAPPAEVIAGSTGDHVRVTRFDGSILELTKAAVSADSLSGHALGSKDSLSRTTIPLADVQSVAVRRISAGKTALLVAGLGVTAMLVGAAAQGDDSPRPAPQDSDNPPVVSCPLVYSWTDGGWRLDSGTFGGAIAPALARTDVDNLVYAAAEAGMLRLRVANELNETDYVDGLSLLVVDHAAGSSVAPDAAGGIHALGTLIPPASARDFRGGDVLARVSRVDGWSWESSPSGRDTAVSRDIRDGLELVFARPLADTARLVVDGHNTPWAAYLMQELVAAHGRETQAWYDSLGSLPALADQFEALMAEEAFLGISVRVNRRWERQGYIWEAGPEISKRQVFVLDLSGVRGDSVHVRLESAPAFWLIDQVALESSSAAPFTVHEVSAEKAVDGSGRDVRRQLGSIDQSYFVMEHGDGAELQFRLPVLEAGRARSYLVRSSGWYRIHGPETTEPDSRLLSQVVAQPHGASKVAVARMNDALLSLSRFQ